MSKEGEIVSQIYRFSKGFLSKYSGGNIKVSNLMELICSRQHLQFKHEPGQMVKQNCKGINFLKMIRSLQAD